MHTFDPDSQVSPSFGLNYQFTPPRTPSIAAAFVRTSFHADHQRIVGIVIFGYIKNDYDDYLGTGQPLKTNDDLKAVSARYLYRVKGDWFIGAQGSAANYQVLGESAEDDLLLETLGVRGFESAALGGVAMHDSRDNPDMPTNGWYLNVNNLAYREAFGGASSFDAYRADLKGSWPHGQADTFWRSRQYAGLVHAPTHPRRRRPPSIYAATSSASISRRTCRRSKPRNACRSANAKAPRCSPERHASGTVAGDAASTASTGRISTRAGVAAFTSSSNPPSEC